MWKGMEVH